jgi:hypothetical protein
MKNRAPQGRRLEDKRLEIVKSADVLSSSRRYPKENRRVEKASVSTQLVLNKYNTNYEALRLADSTALAFNLGKFLLKLFTTSG